ncbi:hypothetical protein ACOMHN_027828 [Nucella lapillus]
MLARVSVCLKEHLSGDGVFTLNRQVEWSISICVLKISANIFLKKSAHNRFVFYDSKMQWSLLHTVLSIDICAVIENGAYYFIYAIFSSSV